MEKIIFLMCYGEQIFIGDRVSLPDRGRVSIDSIDYTNLTINVSSETAIYTLSHKEFPTYLFFVKKID